VNLFITNK